MMECNSASPFPLSPEALQDSREFRDHHVTVIHILDRELTLVRSWVQVEEHFPFIIRKEYLHVDPLASRITGEAAIGRTQLFLSQDDKREGQRDHLADLGWYGFGLQRFLQVNEKDARVGAGFAEKASL